MFPNCKGVGSFSFDKTSGERGEVAGRLGTQACHCKTRKLKMEQMKLTVVDSQFFHVQLLIFGKPVETDSAEVERTQSV